jgi:hypothetical protein
VSDNPFIHLRSPKFHTLPGEEEELVNEGMFGKALALYLQEGLQRVGYAVPHICAEDWGWWVGAEDGTGCIDVCVYGTPDEEKVPELAVSVGTRKGRYWSWSRFRFVDDTARVEKLHADLLRLFAEDPQIETIGESGGFPL